LEVLAHLNQIGSGINRLETGDLTSIQTMLARIVDSATEVVPGSSAVIFTFDERQGAFDPGSRVSAEKSSAQELDDSPRADGLGMRAAQRKVRVLSYEEEGVEINPAKVAMGAKAMACFPLIVSGRLLGVLYVYLYEERKFSMLELLMLENFVNLTAMTLSLAHQHIQAQQEQLRKERELRRLRRAGILISSRSSLKDTLETILKVALEVTDAIYGIFRLVDSSGKNLVCEAIFGEGLNQPAIEVLPIDGHSVMGWVANRREPVIISDLRNESWSQVYYPLDRKMEMRSELAVPLIGGSGRLEGVLNLESPQVNAFDKQNRYILQILATQAVVAIQEARLLDALQEISLMLPRYSLSEIHQFLVERGCDLLNVAYGMIWLLDNDHLVLQAVQVPAGEPVHQHGSLRLVPAVSAGGQTPTRLKLEGSLAGKAVQAAEPVAVLVNNEEQAQSFPDLPYFHGKGSALSVPLFASPDGKPVGAFCVHTGPAQNRDFSQSDWDMKVLAIIGHYAALASQLTAQQEALRVAQDQRALTEAFAAIGDIAANLLHRLNNKIGTIPVRVEGIQDKCASALAADPYLEKNLSEIQRSATEAMDVVRESLFHLHPIQLAPVSVPGSVKEALSSINVPSSVEIVVDGLDTLPPVQAGPRRLGLVFGNLIENAVDAMNWKDENGWKIWISGAASNGWVKIYVSDNGPGIASEVQERIFDFNYSARVSAHPGKLGFGLWWVKSLMARFGGSVAVESDGQSGTTFILSLPQAQGTDLG
ncbi:MAG: GAF domain-containing protein, partial [Anaerolineaceae bacterium]|nr:GAF domain-containing protein [Anaerolineaceae bacterium]